MQPTTASTTSASTIPPVLRHTMRKRWGRAVMVWETRDKRAFQFEDGALRVFKSGFYHLMAEVELPEEEASRLASRLVRQAEREDSPAPIPTAADKPVAPRLREANTIEARLAWFLQRYPGGFAGEKWQREQRGGGTARRRQRDPIVAAAQARLVVTATPAELVIALGEIASQTDLVGPKIGPALLALDEEARERLGEGLQQLLQPEIAPAIRFERWLDRLVLAAPDLAQWSVVTLPLALLEPTSQALIRRTMTRREAVLHGYSVPTAPSAPVYEHLRGLLSMVRDRLTQHGAAPTDLLDVHDFVRITLSPAAQKEIVT